MNWRCFFRHDWEPKGLPPLPVAMWPMHGEQWFRRCKREGCGKRQKWLPGYGGSEIGCWCPVATWEEQMAAEDAMERIFLKLREDMPENLRHIIRREAERQKWKL